MNREFDWDQFQSVDSTQEKESEFDWDQFEKSPERLYMPKIGFGKKVVAKGRSPDEMRRTAARSGKVLASEVLGAPGNIQNVIQDAGEFIGRNLGIPENAQDVLSFIMNPRGEIAGSEKIKGAIESAFPSTKPMTPQEKDWEENLGLATALLLPMPGGKAKAVSPQMRTALYKAGQNMGLSERELAPLFLKKWTRGLLGKMAGKGDEAAAKVRLTQSALGDVYEGLKGRPSAKVSIPSNVESDLISDMSGFVKDLKTTLANTPEEKSIISFVESAMENLMNKGATPEELMNFYRGVNKNINWKSIEGGKKRLAQVKTFVKKALQRSDPSLSKEFEQANELWARSESVIKSLGYKKFHDFVDASGYAAIIGALATGNTGLAKNLALTVAAKKGLSKIATKFMTDPKWQNLHGKSLTAIKNNSPKAAQSLMSSIKNMSKEELSEEEYDDLFSSIL